MDSVLKIKEAANGVNNVNQGLMTAKEVKAKYRISNQTLYNWRCTGKISYRKITDTHFLYEDIITQEEKGRLEKLSKAELELKNNNKLAVKYGIYARVSNTKQEEDLDRQLKLLRGYVASNGYIIDKEFSDIASGMSEQRKGFNELIEAALNGELDVICITFKDRLTRFGFETLERILNKAGCQIIVLNATKEEDFQSELTSDLVAIIHHFSMKLYSNRRKVLKEMAKALEAADDLK